MEEALIKKAELSPGSTRQCQFEAENHSTGLRIAIADPDSSGAVSLWCIVKPIFLSAFCIPMVPDMVDASMD